MNDQARRQGLAALIVITVVGCLISMLSNGIRINYGLISTAIENHTGIAAASVSFAIAIAQLLYGFAQPFFGALALKKSNSMVLIIGALMLLSGFLLTPLCQSAGALDLAFGLLVGGGTGAMAFGIIMGAVTPILGEKKAAAVSGIINGAGGIGGSILSPVTQALMDAGGLRAISACFMILSGLITVVCVWLFTQEKGAVKAEAQEKPDEPVLKQIGEAVRSRDFLHAALAFFTCGYFMAIIETQLYSQIMNLGFPGTAAAFGFTIYGIFGMLGPMLSGFLCTKMRCKWVVGTCYALRPVAVLLFYLMKPSLFSVYFFLIFLGLIGNSTVPPTSNLISKLYGVRKVGLLLGTAFVFHQIGSFISTWLGGILGANGQYLLLWVTGAVLATVAALLCYTVREPAE
ncbi:MAG: MFS transporter [Firmicutes bacterium]|nr:MFS transporter [Bacillota bacterium]